MLRTGGRGGWGWLALGVATAAACAGHCGSVTAGPVEATPERVARGEYVGIHLASCGACHTARESGWLGDPPRPEGFLAGGNVLEVIEPPIRIFVPNITPDPESGLGRWTDEQIARAIRDGIGRHGPLLPSMPFDSFQFMSDDDVLAVVAWLRSVPARPLPRPRAGDEIPWYARAANALSGPLRRPTHGVTAPPRSDRVRYGEYVARLGTCADCHSLGTHGPRGAGNRFLAGSDIPFPEGGLVYAPNLTPDPDTGLGRRSHEDVERALRQGRRLDGRKLAPPMDSIARDAAGMSDDDLDALVEYLFAQRPVQQRVPERRLSPAARARLGED